MNLVAKEGPVVNSNNGVLVLSHSSGVYQQLSDGAISVSPTDLEGTMEALQQAIVMPAEDRKQRAEQLYAAVCREDITQWLHHQMQDIAALM
jgi:trehalose 6-phosphate synthase